jgi:RNA polymerase sigma factor (sigma-70 family)
MRPGRPASDEELLLSGDPEDFGRFYDRHVHAVIGYFARRIHDPEAAADLTAETFAAALGARARFRPSPTPAAAWLFGIAQHKLADYRRRGYAESRARHKLGMQALPVSAQDAGLIALLGRDVASDLLDALPGDQRAAVSAYVIEDVPYAQIAASEQTSEAVVRKRVSRGLGALRSRMGARR